MENGDATDGADETGATDRASESPLAFRTVTVARDGVTTLRDVSLALSPGDLHCLCGPNGAGKTTLLSVALGLTRPSSGSVARSRSIGCSFQEPNVYCDLSVAENLRVFADSEATDGNDWRERVTAAFGLGTVRDRRVDGLSGGYRCRLDLALAFVRRPRTVVLDEPLDELDDESRSRALSFFDEYATDDRCVLVATHDPAAYDGIADRLTVLSDGEVVRDERAEERPGTGLERLASAETE